MWRRQRGGGDYLSRRRPGRSSLSLSLSLPPSLPLSLSHSTCTNILKPAFSCVLAEFLVLVASSMEQQMAQQYRAFEAIQKEKDRAEGAAKGGGKTKEEQEELSIDMMNLQQYKAYEAKMREEER
jgi:hypothetical protein